MKKDTSSEKPVIWFSYSVWKSGFPYLFLILLSLFPLYGFFHAGLPITHDGQDHVARIANFYMSLQEDVIVPRWAANLNWGYGHPILMFLYPFPSYFASLFHLLGLSFVDSVKTVFVVGYILSGLTMYIWGAKQFNKYAGFLGAIVYLFAPYRFVDLQVRGAYGEHVALVFPPLVLYFLLKLSKKSDFFTISLGALSLAGLLLSHNAISLMFLPIFFSYALFLFLHTKEKRNFAIASTILVILGFTLSAFFWIPALIEGKYTLRNIVTDTDFASRFVPFQDFFYGQWSFGGTAVLSKQIGITEWIFVFATGIIGALWYKKRNVYWQLSFWSLVIFIVALFIMTSGSKVIWDHIKILQNFQFPWRFLSVEVFITAVCGSLFVYFFPQKIQKFIVICSIFLTIILTVGYWGINGYSYKPESFYSGIYEGTTDTGESAPIWSVRFMEKKPKAPMEVIEGKATINQNLHKTTQHTYIVQAEEKTRLRENTLYFPGWNVIVDGVSVMPEFQDPKNRGLMTFYVEKGTHTVQILFKETKIRLFADYLSIAALAVLLISCIIKLEFVWKHFR